MFPVLQVCKTSQHIDIILNVALKKTTFKSLQKSGLSS